MEATEPTDRPAPRPRLPDAALPSAGAGPPVPLRARRTGTLVVVLDGAPDPTALAFVQALAGAEATLRASDGRALVVVPSAEAGGRVEPPAPPVLVDAGGRVAAAAGVAAPAVVVADQWGEVWHAATVPPGAPWMEVAEVDRWLGYLAIRCAG